MRKGPIVGGGGGGGLSVTQWHMESGRWDCHGGGRDMYLGRDVGKWGTEGAGNFVFLASRRGTNIFFLCAVCLYSKWSDFCEEFKCA